MSNIILIGMMGTGKSTVGKILADQLHKTFYDLDEMIENEAGITIAQIFKKQGEQIFRKMEHETLRNLYSRDHFVLATGGGTVILPENRNILKKLGWVVWLTADFNHLLHRAQTQGEKRPLLVTENPLEVMEQIHQTRKPFYQGCADFIINTNEKTPEEIAQAIMLAYKERGN